MRHMLLTVPAILSLAAGASAAVHGVTNVVTTHDANGDRTLDSVGFLGSPTVMTPGSIMPFVDGTLSYGNHSYGWNTPAPRDMSTAGNAYPGNPDRADHSSHYAGEAGNTGTLAEVFGVNNLSHIIDGEGGGYQIDLFFAPGQVVKDDGDASTIEFAIFERGWNSKIAIQGIYEDGIGDNLEYTSPIVLTPNDFTYAGWKINTLEIGEDQKVVGAGISVDMFGQIPGDYIGFRVVSQESYEGPDIVGIRAQNNLIPAPGALALLGAAGLGLTRRRR
jgi:hypothetical protein